ncbi:MAG: hypothetical protein ACYCX4_06975 [Bacillota bacterium]
MKLLAKNQTDHTMEFCSGEKEYILNPGEAATVEVKDGDCMYFDRLVHKPLMKVQE